MQRQSARRAREWRIVAVLSSAFLTAYCGSGSNSADLLPGSEDDSEREAEVGPRVRPGIDVLLTDSIHLVRGLRVGLVSNHTGIGADGSASIDRLFEHPSVQLVALFSPEHGIRGTVEGGVQVADQVDGETGLPIHSLYGATLKPTPSMLEGIEALLFDIQDIGARYYTYIYTMALAMEAAGEASIPFIVLDRPNPVGGSHVQGNVLDPSFASFVGRYAIPMRHGMTPGELAILFRQAFGVAVELRVVPIEGWSRNMLFPETRLPWRSPSPNMPNLESALHYSGTCLFEGTNLSVGRGTERPFQWVGAPWLDGDALAQVVSEMGLPGVRIHPARFTPRGPGDGKFDGVEVNGVRLEVTEPETYDPTLTAVTLLVEARKMSGSQWGWNAVHFDRLAGTQQLRNGVEEGESAAQIMQGWAADVDEFRELRGRALLYE